MIEVLANEDVRLALRMTRQFLETGYTNPGRALEIYNTKKQYTLPRHEALRAILQGGASVYKEDLSTIGNPFDARLGRTEAQMLRIYVLSVLVNMATLPSFRYADVQYLMECLRKIGFGDEQSLKVVKDLCTCRFAFNTAHSDVSAFSNLVPSRLGGYIVRELISDMVFHEAMMMDTFIPDESVWISMKQLTQDIEHERETVARINFRIRRVRVFFSMLQTMTQEIVLEATRRSLPTEWCINPFVNSDIDNQLDKVQNSAEKNYGSGIHKTY